LIRWSVAIVAGGGTAGIVQTVMSVVRLKSTALTAGFGNFLVATVELIASFTAAILAILAPAIAILAVLAILVVGLTFAKRRPRTRAVT
jgi:hypothetical protein